ncbi:uncharacterized protein LOC108048965 [Drosophila rhopaloa]|uniref:Glycosyltransferase family 92 protein n=1 Tax=Drosophila rhopaloa TaxID=1041015 RepID=A0A6P4F8N0_DRORH|nr:uncharacterized protein LOC108048965 [Drosophila rhopaloa]
MFYNQLRTFKAPLILVLGATFLFLLFQLTRPLQQPLYFPETSPIPSPLHPKVAVFSGYAKEAVEKEEDYLPPRPDYAEQDLEALLRGNEDFAQGDECSSFPRFENIEFQNPHFQHVQHENLSYYLYGAYYDRRPTVPEVMVLVMVTTCTGPYPATHLRMWFEGDTRPELAILHQTKLAWYVTWGNAEGLAYPTLLTFRMQSARIPQLVSLVLGNTCAVPQNALKVFQPPAEEEEEKEAARPNPRLRTGVCVKFLRFPDSDMSERLVEWLELMRLLGAGRITAYDIGELHPNTSRTLAHYTRSRDGLLDLRKFQFLNDTKGYLPLKMAEVLLYNDCLYRSLYDFDFVAVMDVDEVIMPLGENRNWPDLLEDLQAEDVNCTARCGYCFQNVYFPKELAADETIPEHFYMLRHLVRVAKHLNPNLAIKCLHNTAHVTVVHNHFALDWRDACAPLGVPIDLGQLQHYRHVDNAKTLEDPPPKQDDNIRRFQHQLIHNSMAIHRQLGWGAY